jgi:hypothetical protein
MKELFNKDEKVYLKSKYGMFYEVVIKRIEGDYAFVKGNKFTVGNKKVRLDKLSKEPSESFKKDSIKLKKGINTADEKLYKMKSNLE